MQVLSGTQGTELIKQRDLLSIREHCSERGVHLSKVRELVRGAHLGPARVSGREQCKCLAPLPGRLKYSLPGTGYSVHK